MALGLAEARDLAQLLLGLAAAGIDPLERLHAADRERRAAEDLEALREALGLETVGTLLDRFLELRANPPKDSKEKRARPETLRGWRSLRKNALAPLAGRDPATLTARDVDQWHRETGELRGHPVANRALALLSTCCAWASLETDASGQPLLATNPAADVRPFSEVERQRTLTSDEIRAVWLALDGEDYGDVLRLLLWTGARKTEAFAAEWAEIDIGAKLWTVPPARSKTGVVRRIPLSDAALRMLRDRRTVDPDGRFVFPGRFTGGAVRSLLALSRRVQSRSGVSGWTLHDLRRTTRTGLDDLGVPQAVAKAVLGHLESKLERTYNRNEPLREMRAALNKWARRIDGYVTGGKVVPMARPARREVAQ